MFFKNKKRITIILIIFGLIWMTPLMYVFLNMGKSTIEYNTTPFWQAPSEWQIKENLNYISQTIPLAESYINSLIYASVSAFVGVFLAAMAGYSIATLKIKHGLFWFILLYTGTIFPIQMYLIPNFQLFQATGLYDTKLGMILIYIALVIPFSTFVLRNYFLNVSTDMLESARIDGANDWRIFMKIYLPMAKPSLWAIFLIQFTFFWGELLLGMTLTKSAEARTIMSSVSMISPTEIPAVLCAAVLISIPTLILYLIMSKNIEKGMVFTSK